MCLFVFKPKTAYEMRISDWSSEVCSSDLAGLLDDGARLVKPGGVLVYATCSVLPVENGDQIDRFLGHHGEFTELPLSEVWGNTITEIGRASCRERVCQYV